MTTTQNVSAKESFAKEAKAVLETAAAILNQQHGTKLEVRPATLSPSSSSVFASDEPTFVLAQKREGLQANVFGEWQGVTGVVVSRKLSPMSMENYFVEAQLYALRGKGDRFVKTTGPVGLSTDASPVPADLASKIVEEVNLAVVIGALQLPKPVRQAAPQAVL
ncbi:MAG: hypothetical protein WCD70_07355 [Alphaproteobacteria bacterium]